MRILITTSSFGKYDETPLKVLKENGLEPILNSYGRKLTEAEIEKMIVGYPGVIAGTEPLTENVLTKAKGLKVISRCGAGLDNVDLNAAKRAGITVYNTPDGPTQAVAELTLGLILSCLRQIPKDDRNIRQQKWQKPMGSLLAGKVVGIIGYGRIGRTVSKLIQAFGAAVLVHDIALVADHPGAKIVTFDRLLAESDIITLHIPAQKQLIGASALSKIKQGAYLINASRGGLVDEEALYEALKTGHLAGAGIDTFDQEPYKGKLTDLDNVVLTSHIGSYAKEVRVQMEMQAVENLIKGLGVKK